MEERESPPRIEELVTEPPDHRTQGSRGELQTLQRYHTRCLQWTH